MASAMVAYGYLPSLRWYQMYTAGWQLTAQDINPIAYVPEFAWHNFALQPRILPGWYRWSSQRACTALRSHAITTLSRQTTNEMWQRWNEHFDKTLLSLPADVKNLDSAFDDCTSRKIVNVSSINEIWILWSIALCGHTIAIIKY